MTANQVPSGRVALACMSDFAFPLFIEELYLPFPGLSFIEEGEFGYAAAMASVPDCDAVG